MTTINIRSAYELLRRAIEQEKLQQQQEAVCASTPNGASGSVSSSYDGTQGGLLGRLRALDEAGTQRQPSAEIATPRDSNVRRLAKIPTINRPEPMSERRDSPSDLPYSNGIGRAPFEPLSASRQSEGPSDPRSSAPTLPDWWDTAVKILQVFPRGMYGSGSAGDSARGRCLQASEGSTDDWEDFCRFLDRRQNRTLGGESQNRACWSKTSQSEEEKRGWCENQFGRNR